MVSLFPGFSQAASDFLVPSTLGIWSQSASRELLGVDHRLNGAGRAFRAAHRPASVGSSEIVVVVLEFLPDKPRGTQTNRPGCPTRSDKAGRFAQVER
jgi:hypothetical protein